MGPSWGRAHLINLWRLLFYGGLNYTSSTVYGWGGVNKGRNEATISNMVWVDAAKKRKEVYVAGAPKVAINTIADRLKQ